MHTQNAVQHAIPGRTTAFRVFGTTGAVLLALAVAAAVVRPDMLMAAMHAVMGMMG